MRVGVTSLFFHSELKISFVAFAFGGGCVCFIVLDNLILICNFCIWIVIYENEPFNTNFYIREHMHRSCV